MTAQNFGKIYASMYQGSMVGSGALVFAVMGYVIANMSPMVEDPEKLGVELNPKLLAFILGEGEEEVDGAIKFLCSPDEDSRTAEQEGRRLVKVGQFGYWVVNGRQYRQMQVTEKRKEQLREAQKRFRQRKGVSVGSKTQAERVIEKAARDGDSGTVQRMEGMAGGEKPELAEFREKFQASLKVKDEPERPEGLAGDERMPEV